MKYIKTLNEQSPILTITFGPVLSADGTPYTDLTWVTRTGFGFWMFGDSNQVDIGDDTNWETAPTLFHLGNGFYQIAGRVQYDLLGQFLTEKQYTLSLYKEAVIQPFSLEIFTLSPLAFNEMVYGSGGNFAEATYAAVSGSDNIQDKLASIQADVNINYSDLSNQADVNFQSTIQEFVGVIEANDAMTLLLQELKTIVNKIGSISADILTSGGVVHKSGVIIKDIEVRDNTVFLAYKDTDGKMKVYNIPFTQDVAIASSVI